LRYLSNLDQLKTCITLAPQFIPQRVIEYDRDFYSGYQPLLPPRQKRPVPSLAFGRKLEELAALEGITSVDYVPKFVIQIVNHLKMHGNMGVLLKKANYQS
jgi:hypothetical protein